MSSDDVKIIYIDEPPSYPLSITSENPPEFAHCVIRKGYFDQMLNRIERHKKQPKELPQTEVSLSESIVLEIEKWDGKPFRV